MLHLFVSVCCSVQYNGIKVDPNLINFHSNSWTNSAICTPLLPSRLKKSVFPADQTLTCRPQYRLHSRTCLRSYLSPCGHCVCVIYRAGPRQPSGAFLELICLTAVCAGVCKGQRDTERKMRKEQMDKKRGTNGACGHTYGKCLVVRVLIED